MFRSFSYFYFSQHWTNTVLLAPKKLKMGFFPVFILNIWDFAEAALFLYNDTAFQR